MKKWLQFLAVMTIFIGGLFWTNTLVQAKEKPKVYMFTKDGCSACEYALEYFDGLLKNEPDLFELVILQVYDSHWQVENEDLYNLMIKALEYYGESTKPEDIGTPTIAVYDYLQVGTTDIRKIYDRIVADTTEEDRIALLAEENNLDLDKLKINREALNVEAKKESKKDIYILLGIFIVLIGGFGALVIIGNKK